MKKMERRVFLKTATAGSIAAWATATGVLNVLSGCGDSGQPSAGDQPGTPGQPGQGSGNCQQFGTQANIEQNHGHQLMVSKEDVVAGQEKTYDIQGTSLHNHQIKVTAADFARLQSNEDVSIISTLDAGHTHRVEVRCASS